jgi:hypothetical protein
VTDKPPRFTLMLETLPSDVPAISRLRRLLKSLSRAYAFRVIKVVEEKQATPNEQPRT